jgi:hypothetical protein
MDTQKKIKLKNKKTKRTTCYYVVFPFKERANKNMQSTLTNCVCWRNDNNI